jgi:multidrug efflux pump subunit AcrB
VLWVVVRGVPGTRIEETERTFVAVERTIRAVIPDGQIRTLLSNIGVPSSGINLALGEGTLISPADGQVLIALEEGHAPTVDYVRELRDMLAREHPDLTFFFLAPDMTTQVLNFGLAAPIDVQITGGFADDQPTLAFAQAVVDAVARVPGAVDVHLAQVPRAPRLRRACAWTSTVPWAVSSA